MTNLIWGVYPYVAFTLFFGIFADPLVDLVDDAVPVLVESADG